MRKGFLLLESGEVFEGWVFGTDRGAWVGELCFNTSMTGYEEVLTDPSYYQQIVVFTTPMMGNYGITGRDIQSSSVHLSGIVVREYVERYSNPLAIQSLGDFLRKEGKVGISGIDTRAITLLLRDRGVCHGIIVAKKARKKEVERAKEELQRFPGLQGRAIVDGVSTPKAYDFDEKLKRLPGAKPRDKRLAVIDFGVKYGILRYFDAEGFAIRVFPWNVSFEEVEAYKPHAYFLSNGPGDPKPVAEIVKPLIERIVETQRPIMGICFGHQILSHVLGGDTYKMKFGHRASNHPVIERESGRIAITSHNHGFAVVAEEKDYDFTHINLNDQTVEGLKAKTKPIIAYQFHPEACPGPHDMLMVFRSFYQLVK